MGYTTKWAFGLVSIHALLAECDSPGRRSVFPEPGFNPRTPCGVRLLRNITQKEEKKFQSTHSLRSATAGLPAAQADAIVSIHALLAECDELYRHLNFLFSRFNPRTPCGVRPASWALTTLTLQFQSTHSLRSATFVFFKEISTMSVSIHALLAECDAMGRFARP